MIRRRSVPSLALAAGLLLAACSSAPPAAPPTAATGTSAMSVVASTDVWASVARAVGGDGVPVTSVVDDPGADPHSFEASPRVKLAMSDATVVVVNGGGYDDWAIDIAESVDPMPTLIDATEASGLDTSVDGFDEHVFYDLTAVGEVADAIADRLGRADPAQAAIYTANAAGLTASLAELSSEVAELGAAHPGTQVVVTEPVPGYLIRALGFTDVTPPSFSAAVEAGSEVSVRDLADTENLIASGGVTLLFHNTQTGGPVPDRLVVAATTAGVGVVGVTETLPPGVTDYLAWMRGTVSEVSAALSAGA